MFKFAKTIDIWENQLLIKMNYELTQIDFEASYYDKEEWDSWVVWFKKQKGSQEEMEEEFNNVSEKNANKYYNECLFWK